MTWIRGMLERLVPTTAPPSDAASPRRLLVDVSTIAQHDAHTGIQRVVRAIWLHLRAMDLAGLDLIPVAAAARRGYAVAGFDPTTGRLSLPPKGAPLLSAGAGDIFLGLDLAAHRLARHEGQLASWRRRGASLNVIVYDLLPLQHPEWFPRSTGRNFRKWIGVVARHADRAICISRQVAADFDLWLARIGAPRRGAIALPVIPLSGAVEATNPTSGVGDKGRAAIQSAQDRPTILMVGTVEPRKGHDCLLDAMVHLWRERGADAPQLIMVGRPGWRTDALQVRMKALEAQCPGFIWLSKASDELLSALYARAALVVVASRGEGFGLPIVEALREGCKVLARDLPVFRELARPGLHYFSDDSPAALAGAIMGVLGRPDPDPRLLAQEGWDASAHALLDVLGLRPAEPSPGGATPA